MEINIELLRRLLAARDRLEAANAEQDAAETEKKGLDLEVWDMLTLAKVKGEIKIDVGPPWGEQGFQAGETIYSQVYDEPGLREWAKEHGYYKTLFITDKAPIRKKALNQLVRRMRKAGEHPVGANEASTKRVTVRAK